MSATSAQEAPPAPPSEKTGDEKKGKEEEDKTKNEMKYTAFQDLGVCSDQNWKYRRRMEDAHYTEDGFDGNPTMGFFGVYDGHGGKEAANFAAENLHKVLSEELKKVGPSIFDKPEDVLPVLRKTFLETDEKLKTAVPSHHGCTAVTCLITGKGDSKYLFSGNVGDARAILCRDGKAIRLTEEHKASDVV